MVKVAVKLVDGSTFEMEGDFTLDDQFQTSLRAFLNASPGAAPGATLEDVTERLEQQTHKLDEAVKATSVEFTASE
jgi:hypothetical protein